MGIAAIKDDGTMPEEWKDGVKRMVRDQSPEWYAKYYTDLKDYVDDTLLSIKIDLGYGNVLPEWSYKYLHKPAISVAEKIDALYEYLKLEAKKGELVVVSKKKGK